MICDPPWEAAEQKRERKKSLVSRAPSSWFMTPVALSCLPCHVGGQAAKRRRPDKEGELWALLVPQACVSPPLQRRADSPSPDQLTSQTNEGVWPNSLSTDLP